jgi:hypothetical protein
VSRVADDAQQPGAAFGQRAVVLDQRVDPVIGRRVGAAEALRDAGSVLPVACAQPLRAHLFRHGHPDHDQALVARLKFADHAPGHVGDHDMAGPHLGVGRGGDPVPEPVRLPAQGERTAITCLGELLLGYRVVFLASARRPGDGAPRKAGESTGVLAGIGQQRVLADPAGPDDGHEGAGADRLGHEIRAPCRYTLRTTGTRRPRGWRSVAGRS